MLSFSAKAQYKQILFKTYGVSGPSSEGEDIIELPGGNLLIATTQSFPLGGGAFQADIVLIKTLENGDTLLTRRYGSATSREYVESMKLLPDGRLLLAGWVSDIGIDNADALLVMYDTSGHELWHKRYGSAADEFANAVESIPGGFLVGGVTYNNNVGEGDAWLLRLNQQGDSLWSKSFGGLLYDDCWDVCYTEDDHLLLTGGTYSYASGSLDDAWIIKVDTFGTQVWQKEFGLPNRVDWSWSITPVRKDGLITGYAFVGIKDTEEAPPGAGFGDLHFVRTDKSGNLVWDKSISQPGGYRLEGRDIKQTPDGGFLIGGYSLNPGVNGTQYYVVKTDSLGDKVWDTAIGQSLQAHIVKNLYPTQDDGFVITGSQSTPTPTQLAFMARFRHQPSIVPASNLLDFSLYPNPSTGSFLIEGRLNNPGPLTITLMELNGRVLLQQNRESVAGSFRFEVQVPPATPAGVYQLSLQTPEGRISRKLVVE